MPVKDSIKVEKMHFLEGDGTIKAFCSLLFFDSFIVKGFRVVQGKDEIFVSMPREQGRDGKWYETFSPVNQEMRDGLKEYVLENYNTKKTEK